SPPPRQQPAQEPPRPAAQAEGPAPMEFWELPLDVRRGLPDFRITVLVYDQDPARRFMLLNGKRQVEGDVVAPDLALEQIRRDGAVFRHGRYRFLVKR
ncbi:MAG: general secretion pathway protein GspB, partial [Xanthomonadales bacterium]|nr:general secretion pathway protein GspB [Xanthomonadales bacterium]